MGGRNRLANHPIPTPKTIALATRRYGLLIVAGAALNATPVFAASPFMVVALPDTQYYVAGTNGATPASFTAQTQWIADNRFSSNIAFVTHVGDVVDNAWNTTQWSHAVAAMNILHPPGGPSLVPYGISPGNHDMYDGGPNFLANFGPAHYSAATTWYGGSSPDHLSSFQTFSAGGYNFLHISLQVDTAATTPATALTWARSVVQSHPGLPTIVSVHDYLNTAGRSANGDYIWNNFIQNDPQIFMVLSGHWGGVCQEISTNAAGGNVIEMLADYQFDANGGNAFLREIIFDPAYELIRVRSYSPLRNQYLTDAKNQFAYDVAFGPNNTITVNGPVDMTRPIWVPEPATLGLLALGLLALPARRQRHLRCS